MGIVISVVDLARLDLASAAQRKADHIVAVLHYTNGPKWRQSYAAARASSGKD